jgi:peptide subunit release factor 1 (eRF1)
MQVNDLSEERLRQLARFHVPGHKVLSLYLNLDPSSFATVSARSHAVTSLIDTARQVLESEAHELPHEDRVQLRADLERAEEVLRDGDLAVGAHGVALFCASQLGLFEAIRLPEPVPQDAVLSELPYIEPLTYIGPPDRWYVVLVNRRIARFFRGVGERLEEEKKRTDPVHGRHSQGGRSQPNYQRSIDQEAADHLKRTAEELARRLRSRPVARVLVGATEETYPEFVGKLPSDIERFVVGRFDIDIGDATPDEVIKAATPLLEDVERREERELLDRLEERVGAGGRAAGGLDDVLAALNERRVDTLLFEPGLTAPGAMCPNDRFLTTAPGECPLDGEQLEVRENVVDAALHEAISQSARTVPIRHHPDLGPLGRIAALLRF